MTELLLQTIFKKCADARRIILSKRWKLHFFCILSLRQAFKNFWQYFCLTQRSHTGSAAAAHLQVWACETASDVQYIRLRWRGVQPYVPAFRLCCFVIESHMHQTLVFAHCITQLFKITFSYKIYFKCVKCIQFKYSLGEFYWVQTHCTAVGY